MMKPAFKISGNTRTAFAFAPRALAVLLWAYRVLRAAVTRLSMSRALAALAGRARVVIGASSRAITSSLIARRIVVSFGFAIVVPFRRTRLRHQLQSADVSA